MEKLSRRARRRLRGKMKSPAYRAYRKEHPRTKYELVEWLSNRFMK